MISTADVARVAFQYDIPPWLAAGLAADVALSERIRAERRRPRLEPRKQKAMLNGYLLERERP